MSLLQEIQDAAVDSKTDLGELLRKCKVLAVRLGNDEFKSWVDHEMNGYPSPDSLPPYRVLHVESKGHFSGPLGASIRNASIPSRSLKKEFRQHVTIHHATQPLASYWALLQGKGEANFQVSWPADLVAHVGQDIYEGYNCMAAWKEISRGAVVGLCENVRNRILNFVLDVWEEAPNAGEAAPKSNPVSKERVHQIFNIRIMGNVGNLASGSADFVQRATIVAKGDLASLRRHLEEEGVPAADLDQLERAVRDDEADQPAGKIGKRVAGWMGAVAKKAGSGLWSVSQKVAATVLSKAISAYYGLGT